MLLDVLAQDADGRTATGSCDLVSVFDNQARTTCELLSESFDVSSHTLDLAPCQVSIVIEIEVPWSSYFPNLWSEFCLEQRKISALSAAELADLSTRCAVLERDILPRLHKTVECGIPRGNDRHWEFSMRPVHSASLLVEQVRLLTAAGLLPRDRKHSLHITLGDIPRCEPLYYLGMLLELEFVEPQRIRDGIAQTRNVIHTGWTRKGLAGIVEKGSTELEGGATCASELRMLQLPQTDAESARLMNMVQWGANAIADLRGGRDTQAAQTWQSLQFTAVRMLHRHGLPAENWSRNGQNYEAWSRFADAMPEMRREFSATSLRLGLAGPGFDLKRVLGHNLRMDNSANIEDEPSHGYRYRNTNHTADRPG